VTLGPNIHRNPQIDLPPRETQLIPVSNLSMIRSPLIIESLFTRKNAIDRHVGMVFLEQREAYFNHLFKLGRTRAAIAEIAGFLPHVFRVVDAAMPGRVTEAEIQDAAVRWAQEDFPHRPLGANKTATKHFVSAARGWFRFCDIYVPSDRPTCHFDNIFTQFVVAMRDETGYLPTTVACFSSPARKFLFWAAARHTDISTISFGDVELFLDEQKALGWRPRTISIMCQALRLFFRYAEGRGWCQGGLSDFIRRPRITSRDSVVACPSWKEVCRMLRTLSNASPSHCRAKAILLFASIYGLRCSEVARLTLDDFDWYGETFTVHRVKRGRIQQFPIQYEVGEAVIQYLQKFRPQCTCRNLFVTLKPPYRRLDNLAPAMRSIMNSSGIFSRSYGMHALRHACATELLRKGTPLRSIADFLGHRSMRAVSIYARCDMRSLRKVAKFGLAGIV
jgi:integrase/recombinase XerD